MWCQCERSALAPKLSTRSVSDLEYGRSYEIYSKLKFHKLRYMTGFPRYGHICMYVAKYVVCVCVLLTAAPDEYILNTSKISEDEATDPLIMTITYYALYVIYHSNYSEFMFTKQRQIMNKVLKCSGHQGRTQSTIGFGPINLPSRDHSPRSPVRMLFGCPSSSLVLISSLSIFHMISSLSSCHVSAYL